MSLSQRRWRRQPGNLCCVHRQTKRAHTLIDYHCVYFIILICLLLFKYYYHVIVGFLLLFMNVFALFEVISQLISDVFNVLFNNKESAMRCNAFWVNLSVFVFHLLFITSYCYIVMRLPFGQNKQ